jgi:hypothetical protein
MNIQLANPENQTRVMHSPICTSEIAKGEFKEAISIAAIAIVVAAALLFRIHQGVTSGAAASGSIWFVGEMLLFCLVGWSLWRSWVKSRHGRVIVKSGRPRVWYVEFPMVDSVKEWRLDGFGNSEEERRLSVSLFKGNGPLNFARSFRVKVGETGPIAWITADEERVARTASFIEDKQGPPWIIHDEPLGRHLRVITRFKDAKRAKPDGTWNLRIELLGDPEPPDEICVQPVV